MQSFNLTVSFKEVGLGLSSSVKVLYNPANAVLTTIIPE